MKKNGSLHIIAIGALFVLIVLGLASASAPPPVDLRAGENESIVIVSRRDTGANNSIIIRIYVNDQEMARVRNGQTASFKIQNGQHTISVRARSFPTQGLFIQANSQTINFSTGITRTTTLLGHRNDLYFSQTGSSSLR